MKPFLIRFGQARGFDKMVDDQKALTEMITNRNGDEVEISNTRWMCCSLQFHSVDSDIKH